LGEKHASRDNDENDATDLDHLVPTPHGPPGTTRTSSHAVAVDPDLSIVDLCAQHRAGVSFRQSHHSRAWVRMVRDEVRIVRDVSQSYHTATVGRGDTYIKLLS
jgi:hypothetical protein